ncbi:hypothetical protein TNIN_437291 [Trichonephila inaurata madagascariensis]|uniref:Uncharacterized protein n=1 Tax=Trichonephila inaurata madagascariensis TaxID=2747483 RepID=A0A8X6WZE5_9ARAC|nr:hypothetical protein TNIN_437291 [Trichonephila inaurata madagascariensis]
MEGYNRGFQPTDSTKDYIALKSKLDNIKNIIKELDILQNDYRALPDKVNFKDSLDTLSDLQDEAEETKKDRSTSLDRVREDYVREKVSSIVIGAFEATFRHLSVSPNKADEIKETLLPPKVQKQLVDIVMVMGLERKHCVCVWYQVHKFIFRTDNIDLRNQLVWLPVGIIDEFGTAHNIIQDETPSIVERFHLACLYCLENDVRSLWANVSRHVRNYVTTLFGQIRCMAYWMQALQNDQELNWGQISLYERNEDFFDGNFMGMRY